MRLKDRGKETEDEILRRMRIAYNEISSMEMYDYWIVNDSVDNTVNYIEHIIDASLNSNEDITYIEDFREK